MRSASEIWTIEDQDALPRWQTPILHVALDGFVDAGGVQQQMTDHLQSTLAVERVASFDVDALVDYRGRRPTMTYDRDHWEDFAAPVLVVDRLVDAAGNAMLLLHGVEPDYRWEAFARAVAELCETFGVLRLTTAHGVPMAVPHTRPIGVSRHSNEPLSLVGHEPLFGRVQVPGAAASLLHLRLGDHDIETFGLALHVPHYLAQTPFADAAVAALEAWMQHTGIEVPMQELRQAAGRNRAQIEQEVAESPEAQEVVQSLEQSYDRFIEGHQRASLLAPSSRDLPSADEIAAQLEDFLREQSGEESSADGNQEGEPDSA